MFVQVIQGHVDNPGGLKTAMDRWMKDLAPGASGWLGSTTGVGGDGTVVTLVRFENAAAARANSQRPEQDAWWQETRKLFSDVEFHDCSNVMTMLEGGSDDAGFVQVMEGRVTNPDRAGALMAQSEDVLRSDRPELIGTMLAVHDDDKSRFTEAAYFSSEAEAREGERKTPSAAGRRLLEEERMVLEDVTYLDFGRPWLRSPA
jgi:hypothetical protein